MIKTDKNLFFLFLSWHTKIPKRERDPEIAIGISMLQKAFHWKNGFPLFLFKQVKHQLDLPRNSAFLTDVSLCLAEKMLCLAGKIGKFDKISTLDRHCLFAPLCLEIRRDASQNFSRFSQSKKNRVWPQHNRKRANLHSKLHDNFFFFSETCLKC